MLKWRLFGLALLSAVFFTSAPLHAQDASRSVTIGTGGKSGVYFPVGSTICDMLRRSQAEHGIVCRADSTGGSVDNVNKIKSGELNFGLVQSDILFYAVNGFGPFKEVGPNTDLRTVVALHNETFTVLARADAGIGSFDDLKGKRVNIGNPGSGQRTFLELLMRMKGWGMDAFAKTLEVPADEQAKALCGNEVDAIVYVAGHPNAAIKTAAETCATVLVSVHGEAVHKLIETYPYFATSTIPGGKYPGTPASVQSFGVNAVLVTSANVPDDVVYVLTQHLFNNFTDLKFSHAALSAMTPQGMVKNATSPVHPGAVRYIEQSTDLHKLMEVNPARRY